MEDDIVEWNGVLYRQIYYTPEQFSEGVIRCARFVLSDDAFETFMNLEAYKKYDEIAERGAMYYELKKHGIPLRRICAYIEDVYDNIGDLCELIPIEG